MHRHFADAFRIGAQDAQFHPRERPADCVRTERFEVIQCKGGAGLGQTVSVGHGNPEIVEKLQGRGLHESSACKERQ